MKQTKVIIFDPVTEDAQVIESYPKPSKNYIPDWYKKIPPFTNGDKKLMFRGIGMPNVTLKRCVPFLDALTNGYMVTLEEDVFVEQIDGVPLIRWRSDDPVITTHTPEQHPNFYIPETYHSLVAKWENKWVIKVPKNYSILFSHPSNRLDLPFFTLSGLVNCDTYTLPVNYPFILKKGFEGIIEAGTPICQLHIVKNELWKTKVIKYDKNRHYKNLKTFFKTFVGSYKKNFWKKHEYE